MKRILFGIVILTSGTALVEVHAEHRFDITAGIYGGEHNLQTGQSAQTVSENEKAILRALKFTRLTAVNNVPAYLKYCNSTQGAIRMTLEGLPGGQCAQICWADSSSCSPMAFCGWGLLPDIVFTCYESLTDTLWYVKADSALTDVLEYWGDQSGLEGFGLVDEVYDAPCRPAMEHMASYIHANKPNPRYTVAMSGANVWTAMEEQLFDDLPSVDYWEIYEYPFVSTWNVAYAGPAYQGNWDASIARYDTVLTELKWRGIPYALGLTCDGDTIGDGAGIIYQERMPTPAELRCQVYLALSRGAKGIAYFRADDIPGIYGNILDQGTPRKKFFRNMPPYPNGGYYIYDSVAAVNTEATKLGPYMLNLYPDTGFTSSDASRPVTFVDSVAGNYFEVGVMTDVVTEVGRRYFAIVNRDCNTSTGAPASDRSSTVFLNINSPTSDSILPVIDLLKDDTLLAYACGDRYVLRLNFAPGSGYVLKVGAPLPETPGADNDSDGVEDGCDNCPNLSNADQLDVEGDGLGDVCDPCPNDFWNDRDGDGLCADVDPCPLDSLNDIDGDGICANLDNCPSASNSSQTDSDHDGFGDACDNCPGKYVSIEDSDGDGRGDCCDNCASIYNPAQQLVDADADSVSDCDDNCPLARNPLQYDFDGDGPGDACDYQVAAYAPDTTALAGTQFIWPIYLSNNVPLSAIKLTVQISNVPVHVTLDSITTVGCRTNYFESQQVLYSPANSGKMVYHMKANAGGGALPLPPGDGMVAGLYLHLNPATPDNTPVSFTAPTLGVSAHVYTTTGIDADLPNPFGEGLLIVSNPCACPCHGDPNCDGTKVDVLDVVAGVGVAFRNQPSICDPGCTPTGPAERTDVDCDGDTDVLDVLKMVNVAFRNADPNVEFCDPCVTRPPSANCP